MTSTEKVEAALEQVRVLLRENEDIAGHYPGGEDKAPLNLQGKMLRSRLLLLTAQALDVLDKRAEILAAGIEMVHNASLFHDDVVDETQLRRGKPTFHSKEGNKTAVMVGDVCFSKAMELFCRSDKIRVYRAVSRAVVELSTGQLAEWVSQNGSRFNLDSYFDIVDRKTGSLIKLSLELPGILADLPEDKIGALKEAGKYLGRAFQVADDLLDFSDDPEKTGKDSFSDLRAGKLTYPYLLIIEKGGRFADTVIKALGNQKADFPELKAAIDESGVASKVEQYLDLCLKKARECMRHAVPANNLEPLEELAVRLAFRNR